MKLRELGGEISRAKACYVWVSYTEDEEREYGAWLAITKVQARELIAEARASDKPEIEAQIERGSIYIGLGPVEGGESRETPDSEEGEEIEEEEEEESD